MFALAFIVAVSADVSLLSKPTSNLLAPAPSPLPPAPINIATNVDKSVPFGVNPFGRNENLRPVAQGAAAAPAARTAPQLQPLQTRTALPQAALLSRPAALSAPQPIQQRFAPLPAAPQPSALPAPQAFQPIQQRFASAPAPAAAQFQRLAPLPVIDRSVLSEINAQILRQDQDIRPDGSYEFAFETDNGIFHSQSGTPKAVGGGESGVAEQVTGSFSYIEGGLPIKVTYIADENGFRAFVSVATNFFIE